MEKLTGRVERVTFANDENGYTVLQVKIPGRKELVTAVGYLPGPLAGEFIDMEGEFVDHKTYGRQFQIGKHALRPPATEAALRKYLAAGLLKGVGPVMAGRLVDRFGTKVLDILEHHPERLVEVEGLGPSRRETIINSWQTVAGVKSLMAFLAEFGIGPALARRAIKRLGDHAAELIRQDPYRLAYDVRGIGFATADKVARHIGLAPDSPRRLEAGLLFALQAAADQGHVFCPDGPLLKKAAELMPEAEAGQLRAALNRLMLSGQVQAEGPGGPEGESRVYLPELFRAENRVAANLGELLRSQPAVAVPRQEKALAWAEKTLGLSLSPGQREAVRLSLAEKVLVITGGPGTGKTTVTRAITAIFGALKAKMALVAPTGRAAKRLGEATGLPAKTIHRLLEYAPGGFQRGPRHKLEADLLLVDEASMLDITLMACLTAALPAGARLILVGDQDQLPSVGPGRVLGDLVECGAVAVARLTDIYRQAGGSQIILAAHQVKAGLAPDSSDDRDTGDFYFLEESDPAKVLEKVVYLVSRKLPAKLGLDPLADIQVITPMRKFDLGTDNLNRVLGETLNGGPGRAITRGGRRLKTGDKVMQVANNYQSDVFNGDMGVITDIDPESQEATVNFDGRLVAYDFSDLDQLTLAYAITIHKSQGSEFPAVVIPLVRGHYIMLQRNLLYTALTRGRRFVVIVGDRSALARAVANDAQLARYSRLGAKVRAAKKG